MVDRWLADRNLVTREEFDAVRAMAEKAREENEALKARLEALEKGEVAGRERVDGPLTLPRNLRIAAQFMPLQATPVRPPYVVDRRRMPLICC